MSPYKSISLIRPTGDIDKFPPVTPPSLQNENKESLTVNVTWWTIWTLEQVHMISKNNNNQVN